jgi:phospho-N-acetylmuramoyl-pentapeptide-transferase
VLAVHWANVSTDLSFTRYDSLGIALPAVGVRGVGRAAVPRTSNGVNLTDGLDGLGRRLVGLLVGRLHRHRLLGVPPPRGVPGAQASTCARGRRHGRRARRFLWWNAPPARIFMGDTGRSPSAPGLAAMALVTSTHLLLPIIGGIFVIETLSVITQVASFRLFGRRLYRMAPIHHHFELGGWPETTVIVRFWILAGLSTALAIGIYYADYLSIPGAID